MLYSSSHIGSGQFDLPMDFAGGTVQSTAKYLLKGPAPPGNNGDFQDFFM